jgi:hypothetical protein
MVAFSEFLASRARAPPGCAPGGGARHCGPGAAPLLPVSDGDGGGAASEWGAAVELSLRAAAEAAGGGGGSAGGGGGPAWLLSRASAAGAAFPLVGAPLRAAAAAAAGGGRFSLGAVVLRDLSRLPGASLPHEFEAELGVLLGAARQVLLPATLPATCV